MYAQQTSTYPYFEPWPLELQPFLGSPWPEQNVVFDSNGNNPSYLGPRSGAFACPAYNRLHGEFLPIGNEEFSRGAYTYNTLGTGRLPGTGYGYNDPSAPPLGLGGSGRLDVVYSTRENQVLIPSDMIALSDAPIDDQVWQNNTPYPGGLLFLYEALMFSSTYGEAVLGLPPADRAAKANGQRHAGRWNVGFCDGHVKSLRTSDLFNLTNSVVAMRWNNDHKPHIQGWIPPYFP